MKETRFKEAEVGIIPEDWEVVHISDLAQNFTGLTYSPDNVKEYGTLVLRSSNIQDGKLCYNDNVFVDMVIPDRTKVRKNDILVCVRNGSAKLIGKCAIIDEVKSETAFGAFMTILRAKENVNPHFIHYIWQSNPLQKQVKDNLGATINQITNKDIDNFVIAVPSSLGEQSRIATALSNVDSLISELGKLIEKKRAIKQGAMQQLLTGKKRLKGFSEPWVEKKLGEIAEFIMGQSPSSIFYNTNQMGLPLIQGNADLENRAQIVRYYTTQITKVCEAGDIILSVRAPVGAVGKASYKSCIGRGVCAIKYENDYFYHYLVFFENKWNEFSKGSTFDSINSDELKSIKIILPISLAEQSAIASVLTSMDDEISALEAKKAKYEQIKQGMMQQLLTGKIRLTD